MEIFVGVGLRVYREVEDDETMGKGRAREFEVSVLGSSSRCTVREGG